jgi:hypothetical protein
LEKAFPAVRHRYDLTGCARRLNDSSYRTTDLSGSGGAPELVAGDYDVHSKCLPELHEFHLKDRGAACQDTELIGS